MPPQVQRREILYSYHSLFYQRRVTILHNSGYRGIDGICSAFVNLRQESHKLLRKRSFKLKQLPGHGVCEFKPRGMQEIAFEFQTLRQVILLGNGRGYLAAIVTGKVERALAEPAFEKVNANLPHYKQIRMFHVEQSALTIESGLLTANGKLKRDAIAARFGNEIAAMYQRKAG